MDWKPIETAQDVVNHHRVGGRARHAKKDALRDRGRCPVHGQGHGNGGNVWGGIGGWLNDDSSGQSEGTVQNYLSEAISKLGASNRVEAARIAREKGWL